MRDALKVEATTCMQPMRPSNSGDFETALAARAFAYETLGWTTAISLIAPDNGPSKRLAERLGATYIKLGQFLSSRLDVLPPEVTAPLAALQDAVPEVPFDQIRTLLEAELDASIEPLYERFDPVPMAAASLGGLCLGMVVLSTILIPISLAACAGSLPGQSAGPAWAG